MTLSEFNAEKMGDGCASKALFKFARGQGVR